jgi:Ca2+-binding RTX toxin-like protein
MGEGDDDLLDGGSGHDGLEGGDGDDGLYGGNGNDTLFGDTGDDWLEGEDGDDWLEGNQGDDTLTGGTGADSFVIHVGEGGTDLITDFDMVDFDRIVIKVDDPSQFDIDQLRIVDDGTDVHLTIGDTGVVIASLSGGGFAALGLDSLADLNALSQGTAGYDVVVFE